MPSALPPPPHAEPKMAVDHVDMSTQVAWPGSSVDNVDSPHADQHDALMHGPQCPHVRAPAKCVGLKCGQCGHVDNAFSVGLPHIEYYCVYIQYLSFDKPFKHTIHNVHKMPKALPLLASSVDNLTPSPASTLSPQCPQNNSFALLHSVTNFFTCST